jgi:hypothetical protein
MTLSGTGGHRQVAMQESPSGRQAASFSEDVLEV